MKRFSYFLALVLSLNLFLFCNSNHAVKNNHPEEELIDSFATITMIFVGDIMGHDMQISAAWSEETQTYDYVHCFQYVKPILSEFDLAFGNLEVTLPGKPPYAGYPQFKSPDALAYALKDAGFDVMVTANNHSNDGYGAALIHTIDTLIGLGFYQTGTFKNMAERDSLYPLIIEEKGFKIAVLNYTYGTNGIPDEAPTVVNMINRDVMKEDIEKAKSLEPDLIIALMHWGDEYQLIENKYQSNNAKFLAENGVDLIIGSHPHVLQPVKYVSAGDSDSVLTVYSLGNYISNQRRVNTDGGMMFEISYKKNIFTNEVRKHDYAHHIVWRYRAPKTDAFPDGRFFVIPVAAYEAELLDSLTMPDADVKAMNDFTTRMRKHMKENSVSTERLNKAYQKAEAAVEEKSSDTKVIEKMNEILFHVQLLATSQPSIEKFDGFFVKVIEIKEANLYKYLTIGYANREDAEKIIPQIKESGFEDSFIVRYHGNTRVFD
jgi:poly-gamma-glutamate capsule biosynthesis protein CapA/YwtB (metallophosphatase superfamily)